MAESWNAYNCQRSTGDGKRKSSPKFLEQPSKKKWLLAMKEEKQILSFSKESRSCHFKKTDSNSILWSPPKNPEHDVVPSSHDFQQHLQEHTKSPLMHKRTYTEMYSGTNTAFNQTLASIPNSSMDRENTFTSPEHLELEGRLANVDSAESPPKKRCFYLDDFNYNNRTQYSMDELVRFMYLAKTALARKNRLIKLLKHKKRRQQKKIDSLTSLLRYLQNKNRTIPDAA